MSGTEALEMRQLQATVARQAAEFGQLRAALARSEAARERLQIERDEARLEAEGLRRKLTEVTAELQKLVDAVQRSGERLRNLVRREFGAASERLITDPNLMPEILAWLREQGRVDEQALAAAQNTSAEAAPAAGADGDQETDGVSGPKARRRPVNAGGRKPLPEDLPRREVAYQPPEDHPALRYATAVELIGSTVWERLNITGPVLEVERITCPVVRITGPTGLTWQETLTPPAVIPRGQVSDAFLVQTAVDKVADHLPAYRQQQRFARIDADIPRAKLCRWHIGLATVLSVIAEAIFGEILAEPVIGIDDSVHRLQVAGRSTCLQGRDWAVSAEVGIYYMFTETREGAWITDLLGDYTGAVMGDGYAGHHQLLNRPGIQALFCWAHVRRKFFEAADRRRRAIMLHHIGQLYALEKEFKPLTTEERQRARRARAQPVLAQIKELLDAWAADKAVLPQSGIGRAVAYTLKLWPGLVRYCEIGAAPIDNNRTEQGMRRVAMFRKNSLFSASIAGAQAHATLLTLVQTALLHNLDPIAYLNDILQDLHHDRRPADELTPAAYARRVSRRCTVPN